MDSTSRIPRSRPCRSGLRPTLACACAVAGLTFGGTFVSAQSTDALAKVAAMRNVVEAKPAESEAWSGAVRDQELGARDRVRTGAESRAAILYSDDTLHRLDEKSEVEILPPQDDKPGLLKVLSGKHYFSSRKPKNFGRVETATVTAAIKGTEFTVDLADDGTTTITMLEGVVEASNEYGSVEVGAGERAVTEPGKAPVRSVVVRPRDAVAWALYYPPVLGERDRERLDGLGADGDALKQAAERLASGRVDEARALFEDVLERRPDEPVALSMAAVVALVGDRRDDARSLAERALEADRLSAAAALAASYVAQADFDIARAAEEAERAARLDTDGPTALARAAEMRLAQGDARGAREAARRALDRSPDDARSLSVMGFVELTRLRTDDAAALFERALGADSNLANAHLGLGIAQLRQRRLAAGRERIQSAALLDSSNSLMHSYLGKAYYEEKRPVEALKEFDLAKELDASDPTPWLYSSILLQNENRPVEALDALLGAVERNDNRAVYRSRMLLDEDRAVRSADLARIYNDLGFEEAGLVTARRSADADQANHSGHWFLAGNYRNQPGFASAFFSEVLQARIYQPVSTNAARPDAVNASASFNEYTSLFDRPRYRVFAVTEYGETDTDLSDFCGGAPCPNQLDDSNSDRAQITLTTGGDRYAAALSYSTFSDDGFRFNADQENRVLRGFVHMAVSDRDNLQINAIRGSRETGDLPFRQILPLVSPERFDTDETNVAVGWHRKLSPQSDLAVSATWNRTEQTAGPLGGPALGGATVEGPQLEAQWVQRRGRTTWIAGAGSFNGTVELTSASGPGIESDDVFHNGYAYLKLRGSGPLEWTFGGSIEDAEVPVGLLPPRDSNHGSADLPFDETLFSPKVGLTATFASGTTLRAGVYRRLAPFLGRLQTLEPTQVAGFNQFFEDPGGSRSWNYGAGFDQRVGRRWFFGASHLFRDVEVPEAYCDRATVWNPFSGCAFQTPSVIERRDDEEQITQAYVSVAPVRWLAASVDFDREDRDLESTAVTPLAFFQDRVTTSRVRPELRFFSARGVFVRVAGTHYDQTLEQFDDLTSPVRTEISSDFWTLDGAVGYRFPGRWGSIVLDARNITNRKFLFYERSIQERVIPTRSIVARLEITY